MTPALIVYVTAANRKEADKIAQALVEENLAGCVSIVPEIYSRYRWRGHVEYEKELLLMIKTERRLYKRLEKRILSLHTYKVPEILAIPILSGNPTYLKWLKSSLA
jgi:periplasmic divalent cation tolerance protein